LVWQFCSERPALQLYQRMQLLDGGAGIAECTPGTWGMDLASCTIAFTIAQCTSGTGVFTIDHLCGDTSFATHLSGLV
jgi:hypothetical protein